jgi:hypothetical protein
MAGILASLTVVLSSSRSAAIRRGADRASPAPAIAIALSKRRRVWFARIINRLPPPAGYRAIVVYRSERDAGDTILRRGRSRDLSFGVPPSGRRD